MKKLSLLITIFSFTMLLGDQPLFKTSGYSTHQPVLYATVKATTGPVIEFGTGFGSTDLLHEMCRKEGRTLISIDDDKEWLEKFQTKYLGDGYEEDNSGWHKFYYVPGRNGHKPDHWIKFLNEFDLIKELTFDVCFIDQWPWLGRVETLKVMKDKARFVLVHDVDYFAQNRIFGKEIRRVRRNKPGIYDFSDVFTYSEVYFPNPPWVCNTGPPTLLGSQFESEFPIVDFDKDIVID